MLKRLDFHFRTKKVPKMQYDKFFLKENDHHYYLSQLENQVATLNSCNSKAETLYL